jgi:hypothetical protein
MRIRTTVGRRGVPLTSALVLAGAVMIGTAGPALAASTPLTLSTFGGPSGGGNTITATVGSNTFTAGDPTKSYVQFQYRATGNTTCAATYTTAAPITVATGVQTGGIIDAPSVTVPDAKTLVITVPSTLVLGGTPVQAVALYNVCVYSGNTAGTSAEIADTDAAAGYKVVPYQLNLNTYAGPSAGGNTITVTTTGGTITASSGVEFQYGGTLYCAATYTASAAPDGTVGIVPAPGVTLLTSTKAAVSVPAALVIAGGQTSAPYNVCLYNGTTAGTSTLIAGTAQPYVIAPAVGITSITPTTGPAQGGTAITVVGTAFPASGMTATLGGVALDNVVVAGNGLSFTATTPPHAAGGPFNLSIATLGGTATKSAAFTYTNGITISPTTAPSSVLARTWMDVRGVGFNDISFTTTNGTNPNSANGHVYLVRGVYSPVANGSAKTNPQTLECVDVAVIDDTELICGMFLAGNQSSATTTRTVSGCATTVAAPTILTAATTSTTCTFTAADVGNPITGTGLAANTIIAAVTGPTTATLSKSATAAVTTTTTLTLSSSRTITDGTISLAGTALSSTAAPFTTAEVGKAVSAPGVLPTGTVITAVNGSGVATVSNAATAAATGTGATATMQIFTATPVPNGTYTVTVVSNGAVGGQTATNYSQSIISSGSTFTVADYLR